MDENRVFVSAKRNSSFQNPDYSRLSSVRSIDVDNAYLISDTASGFDTPVTNPSKLWIFTGLLCGVVLAGSVTAMVYGMGLNTPATATTVTPAPTPARSSYQYIGEYFLLLVCYLFT
jgi:hypothetical protein